MKTTLYNSETRKIKILELEDFTEELLNIFDEMPDIPDFYLLFEKEVFKLKFQVTSDNIYRITLGYKEEEKHLLGKKEKSEKLIQLFSEDLYEYLRFFEKLEDDFKENYETKPINSINIIHIEKEAKNINEDTENLKSDIYKTYKGKKYTKEEWETFENKKWEEYMNKQNKNTESNSNSFFLGENKYEG